MAAADVAVLDDPRVAVVALDPRRARLLAALATEPASAAALAAATGLPRQRLGYHLKALEDAGLVVEVERRRHGGLTERVLAPTAASYVVSPAAMGAAAVDPGRVRDRLSAAFAIALAARAVRELGALVRGATAARRRLPTLAIETDIRFRSADDRAAFAADLATAVTALAARYHDDGAPGGRWYRLVALSHPRPRHEEEPR